MDVTVVDTCCLINLYASGRFVELVEATISCALIPEHVFREAIRLRKPSDEDADELVMERVDSATVKALSAVEPTDLVDEAERSAFVELATVLDDGEAACLSIAGCRGLAIATDDRKALRLAAERGVPIVTTPAIIQDWAKTRNIASATVSETLQRIEVYARFRPHHSSEYSAWWTSHIG